MTLLTPCQPLTLEQVRGRGILLSTTLPRNVTTGESVASNVVGNFGLFDHGPHRDEAIGAQYILRHFLF